MTLWTTVAAFRKPFRLPFYPSATYRVQLHSANGYGGILAAPRKGECH